MTTGNLIIPFFLVNPRQDVLDPLGDALGSGRADEHAFLMKRAGQIEQTLYQKRLQKDDARDHDDR